MSGSFKSKATTILTSDWTVTLIATMVGIFSGIYLNDLFTRNSLEQASQQAIERVEQEINTNRKVVENTFKVHRRYFPVFQFIFKNRDDNQDLVVASSAMRDFQRSHPGTFVIADSVLIKEDTYKYRGEVDMKFGSLLSVQLTDIAWETLQSSNLSSTLNYDCLYYLEAAYRLQGQIRDENSVFLETLMKAADEPDQQDAFFAKWKFLLNMEESLINIYNASAEALQDCR